MNSDLDETLTRRQIGIFLRQKNTRSRTMLPKCYNSGAPHPAVGSRLAPPPFTEWLPMILKTAVDRGAIAQLIGSPALAQKPQLTHRVSPRFCTNAFNPSSCTLHPRSTAESRLKCAAVRFGQDELLQTLAEGCKPLNCVYKRDSIKAIL